MDRWHDQCAGSRFSGCPLLTEHLNLFVNLSDEAAGAEIMVEKTNDDKEKALEMTIEELDLKRAFLQLPEACRYQHGGRSGQQERGRDDEVRNLGRKSLEEVMAKLDSLGLQAEHG